MNTRVVLLAVVAVALLLVLVPEGASAAGSISWDAGTSDGNTMRYEGTGDGDYAGYTFVRWEYVSGDGSTTWTVPAGVTAVDVLVVAGGGGAGPYRAGGGGAGGVKLTASHPASGEIPITVGSGGAGSTDSNIPGTNGGDSTFDTTTTTGGGGGAGVGSETGQNGGSGGGGANGGAGGSGIDGEGHGGGAGASNQGGGGGGGKGESGYNGINSDGGDGGDGVDYSSYFGTGVGENGYFGGGGGGGAASGTGGTGGLGGGGDGSATGAGEDGTDGTGGGGGSSVSTSSDAGDGGSGIVIIRYATPADPTPRPTSTPLNLTRPAANTTIAPISTSMYTSVLDLFGNDQTVTDESGAVNWSGILPIVAGAYTAAMGKLGLILVFAIPFVMMWIVQRDTTLPGLVGLLLGLFIIVMLPVQMMHVAIAVMAMSITAVIYSLLKERM